MPKGWESIALGSVFELSNKRLGNYSDEPEIFAISKYEGVVLAHEYFEKRIASKSLYGYKLIDSGDWVYSTIHIDEGSIAVNHHPFPGVVSPMYTSMSWKSVDNLSQYFELLLKSEVALKVYVANAQGTVNRRRSLNWKVFSELKFEVPPLEEQKRIVDVVSSVDAYIDALQQQADTARTARNAVLHELLTAGGDDWTDTTLGDIAEVVGGGTPSTSKEEFWNGDVVWLTPTEVTAIDGKVISDSKRKITQAGLQSSGARVLPVGTVILTSRASVGFVALAGTELTTNQGFQSLIPTDLVDGVFLMFWIQMNRSEFESRSAGSTFKEISKSNVKSIAMNLPPLAEQKRIVEIVSSMDEVIQSTEQAVVDAEALRSGLLSDLLSGNHEIPTSYDSLLGAA